MSRRNVFVWFGFKSVKTANSPLERIWCKTAFPSPSTTCTAPCECFFCVADWHALTDSLDTGDVAGLTREMVIDWLSVGVDPDKVTLFVQSVLPQHAELHLVLSMVTPLPWVERCPTFKDKLEQLNGEESSSYGLLGYPVLQTSDIVIYKANWVPVGEDQLPHLELAREIVRRYNYTFGEVFPEPQALLTETPKLPGLDGRKMSKSYRNSILLSDDEETLRKKVNSMITDPARIRATDPGHPDICTVFAYHQIYSRDGIEEIRSKCEAGTVGCTKCKGMLADHLVEALAPIWKKREELTARPQWIDDVLAAGIERARKVCKATMAEVRSSMGLYGS